MCDHVAKPLSDEGLSLEAVRMVAANKAVVEISHFMRGPVLWIEVCVELHIVRAKTSVGERDPTAVEIVCSVEDELHDIVFGQFILSDDPLVALFRAVT